MDVFTDINIVRWLLSVLVLAILLGVFALVAPHIGMRRNNYHRAGKKKRIKLLEALHLDPKRKVIVFRVGDIEHTLLTGPHEDIHLAAEPVTEEKEIIEEVDLPIGFLKKLSRTVEGTKPEDKSKGKKNV